MSTGLPSECGRFGIGFLAAGLIASCGGKDSASSSSPPKKVCFGGPGACLTIVPPAWTFTSRSEVHTFTIKNTGPDPAPRMFCGIFGGNASPSEFVPVQDNCSAKTLVVGDSCTIGVQTFADPGHDANFVVGSDNSQLDTDLGVRGVKAPISLQ